MSLSRRSLLTGIATVAVVPSVAQASTPDAVTVCTMPPLASWPDWEPLRPDAQLTGDIKITADSLRFLDPAPGYRFREVGAGVIIHEPAKKQNPAD